MEASEHIKAIAEFCRYEAHFNWYRIDHQEYDILMGGFLEKALDSLRSKDCRDIISDCLSHKDFLEVRSNEIFAYHPEAMVLKTLLYGHTLRIVEAVIRYVAIVKNRENS